MGRLVTNPPKPVVRVKVAQTNYRGIANLAQTVHDDTLTNVATFATPVPTSAAFQTAITALFTALASLGTKTNRGGSTAKLAVQNEAFNVFAMLTERQAYVQQIVDASTSPADQAVIISQSGFATKSKKSKIPKLQFVRRVRQSNTKQFPHTLRRVDWKQSLGLYTGNRIVSYNIYGLNADRSKTLFLTSTTATNFLAPVTAEFAGGAAPVAYIKIEPINAAGMGNSFTIPVR